MPRKGTPVAADTAIYSDKQHSRPFNSIDQMQPSSGKRNYLRAGDVVTMKVIHTPSGKVIWR